MRVRAAPDTTVPMEHQPRRHITAAEAVTVPDSLYYRRRVATGELILEPSTAASTAVSTDSAGYSLGPGSDGGMDPRRAQDAAPADTKPAPPISPRKKGSHA